ncbi:unnamed protein product [Closterium sp. Naga37s-1]|nr:unnamed protein product [Closterium sp. Naga37s-1]
MVGLSSQRKQRALRMKEAEPSPLPVGILSDRKRKTMSSGASQPAAQQPASDAGATHGSLLNFISSFIPLASDPAKRQRLHPAATSLSRAAAGFGSREGVPAGSFPHGFHALDGGTNMPAWQDADAGKATEAGKGQEEGEEEEEEGEEEEGEEGRQEAGRSVSRAVYIEPVGPRQSLLPMAAQSLVQRLMPRGMNGPVRRSPQSKRVALASPGGAAQQPRAHAIMQSQPQDRRQALAHALASSHALAPSHPQAHPQALLSLSLGGAMDSDRRGGAVQIISSPWQLDDGGKEAAAAAAAGGTAAVPRLFQSPGRKDRWIATLGRKKRRESGVSGSGRNAVASPARAAAARIARARAAAGGGGVGGSSRASEEAAARAVTGAWIGVSRKVVGARWQQQMAEYKRLAERGAHMTPGEMEQQRQRFEGRPGLDALLATAPRHNGGVAGKPSQAEQAEPVDWEEGEEGEEGGDACEEAVFGVAPILPAAAAAAAAAAAGAAAITPASGAAAAAIARAPAPAIGATAAVIDASVGAAAGADPSALASSAQAALATVSTSERLRAERNRIQQEWKLRTRERERQHEEKKAQMEEVEREFLRMEMERKDTRGRVQERRAAAEELQRAKAKPVVRVLSEEEEKQVKRAFQGGHSGEELAFHEGANIIVTRNHMRCLMPGGWLNDEVINMYLELLKDRERRTQQPGSSNSKGRMPVCHFFNTFFYARLTGTGQYLYNSIRRWTTPKRLGYSLVDCDKIIVPVHQGVHWVLAVIAPRDKRLIFLDSLHGQDRTCLENLARYYADEVKDKTGKVVDTSGWERCFPRKIPQQMNTWDCGVFMLMFAECEARAMCSHYNFSQKDMEYFRKRIVLDLMRKHVD